MYHFNPIVGCGLLRLSNRLEIVGCGYIKNSRLRVGYAVNQSFTNFNDLGKNQTQNDSYSPYFPYTVHMSHPPEGLHYPTFQNPTITIDGTEKLC